MGNKKNRLNHYNNHRYVYKKKKYTNIEKNSPSPTKSKTTEKSANCTIHGSRIINIDKLREYINSITKHVASCGGEVVLTGEKRNGLASILSTKCTNCGFKILFPTSKKVKGPRGIARWECNLAAVWGQMTTGGGHTTLGNTMGVLGVPVMSKGNYISTQSDIGEWWRSKLNESMVEAGKEEKRLAEENGDYHQGVPTITVIVDAGWSKRAHKHSYNAKSGVGVIIGLRTNKLLYIGVRNKYCASCSKGISAENHKCYKNWDKSSSEMEADIILEGFRNAEKTHGIRYTKFVGDGDSAVYPTLLTEVPIWGRSIEKIECSNHACKCYRNNLEKLVNENPQYKGKGGLTQQMRKRLTSAARCAIKMRSTESNKAEAVKQLKKDLINGPLHCFGHHAKCSADFCKFVRQTMSEKSSTSANEDSSKKASGSSDVDPEPSTFDSSSVEMPPQSSGSLDVDPASNSSNMETPSGSLDVDPECSKSPVK